MFGPAAVDRAPDYACDPTAVLAEELEASAELFDMEGYDLQCLQMKDRPGFKPFVSAHKDALKALANMRDESQVLAQLTARPSLLEGVAHVRAWYFDRHLAASKTARLAAQIEDEAAGFMLLDSAADFARAHFMRNPNDIRVSAAAGVRVLAGTLADEADTAGLRALLGTKVQRWTALIKQAAEAERSRQQMKSKSRLQLSSKKKQEAAAAPSDAPVVPVGGFGLAAVPAVAEALQPTGAAAADEAPAVAEAAAASGAAAADGGKPEADGKAEEEQGLMALFKGWWGS